MSKANRVATEKIVEGAGVGDLDELNAALKDPDFSLSTTPFGTPAGEDSLVVKDAVAWKGGDESDLPSRVRQGLNEAQSIAAQTRGSTGNGTKTDPATGNEVPGHVLQMRSGSGGMMPTGEEA